MGSKTAARDKMSAAGVPIVPGARCETTDEAVAAAKKIGFPVMLKAASGGGGKGMRLVASAEEMAGAWERARSEAKKFFGDDTVYLEKAIIRPRHVEIQVLGDREGNLVHVFERDCSIQRRNQKVVEETPSPAASRELVARMGAIAVQGAKSVGYFSAGTFEFLLADDGSFYFLEMNTRLQVEHPVTELVTGLDLVREMVRVAQGETLGFAQGDLSARGAAIECRVYAEDPSTGFLPSPGVIDSARRPVGPGRARRRRRLPRVHDLELLRPAHLEAERVGTDARARGRPDATRALRVRRDRHPHEPRVPREALRAPRVRRGSLRHGVHRALQGRPAHLPAGQARSTRGGGRRDRRGRRPAGARDRGDGSERGREWLAPLTLGRAPSRAALGVDREKTARAPGPARGRHVRDLEDV